RVGARQNLVVQMCQYGPNTGQNEGAGPTRDKHETTRCMTPLNLQNLHPRFKSERRLQIHSSNSIVCAAARQANAFNWTTVDYKSAGCCASSYGKPLIRNDLIVRVLEKGR